MSALFTVDWHPESPYATNDNRCADTLARVAIEQRGRREMAAVLQTAIAGARERKRERIENELRALLAEIRAVDAEVEMAVEVTHA